MKEIKPKGWIIYDGFNTTYTEVESNLSTAKRFNWKITPLYSAQSLAEVKTDAVIEFNKSTVFGHSEGANEEYCKGFDEALEQLDNMAEDYANKLRGGEL